MSAGMSPLAGVAVGRGKSLTEALHFSPKHTEEGAVISPEHAGCICDRQVKMVLCRSCGMTFKGRVRQRCKLHPNNIHLMDHDVCPNCKATQLLEFTEMADKRVG